MATPPQIDTTNLLTIMGVIAAVWALISPSSRLRLRFCMAWWDWIIGLAIFFLIHYLVFAPVLESLNIYYNFGPWKWGLDSSSGVYLILVPTVIYFFWRTRHPNLVRGKIDVFHELVDKLHLTKRYDELVLLVEPQLKKLKNLAKQEDEVSHQAHEILFNLVTSPELTAYLSVAHPYFCLQLLETDEGIRSDFIESYIEALLDVSGSRLYVELKNSQQQVVGSRLFIPKTNRLLNYFFSDASKVPDKGLSRAIGETVCRRLDEDQILIKRLSGPIGYYVETGRFHCPINSGLTLFEIMVHEGIHQGLQDHMWLHYFHHFARRILKQITDPPEETEHLEWPTPFHYLLHRLFDIATDWVEQSAYINDEEIPKTTSGVPGFNRHLISASAATEIGTMLEMIVSSDRISIEYKKYILGTIVRSYIRVTRSNKIPDVAHLIIESVCSGSGISKDYFQNLRELYGQIDHVLRSQAEQLSKAIEG